MKNKKVSASINIQIPNVLFTNIVETSNELGLSIEDHIVNLLKAGSATLVIFRGLQNG